MEKIVRNQFEQEYKTWQTSLDFLRQENVLLKYRLSEMVDNDSENHFLQMAEYFQNESLLKDEGIKKLIDNIQKYLIELNEVKNEKRGERGLIGKQEGLRNKISKCKKDFLTLSHEFSEKMVRMPVKVF
ncbi:MAG: hypothetical protein ABI237_16455 [Ginsengibacter sp.]